MAKAESAIFTNMCMVTDGVGNVLVQDRRNPNWPGATFPGGHVEIGESFVESVIREVREETGYIVEPKEHFLTLKEYYGDWCYISHYFRCDVVGQGSANLTELEQERGLIPEWVNYEDACAIFAAHESYAHWEEKRGSYQREDMALRTFREMMG